MIYWGRVGFAIVGVIALAAGRSAAQSLDNVVLPSVDMPAVSDTMPASAMPNPPSVTPPAPESAPAAVPAEIPVAMPEPELPPISLPESTPPTEATAQMPEVAMPEPTSMPEPAPAPEAAAMPNAVPTPEQATAPADVPTDPAMPTPATLPDAGAVPGASPAFPAGQMAALPSANPASPLTQPVSGLSIGTFGISLMYSDEDINNLKQVLEVFEAVKVDTAQTPQGQTQEADLLAELLRASRGADPEAMPEMVQLPSFYIGTIMIHRPGDWSVWVNGALFNKKKMDNQALGIRIVGVSRDMVTLAWKPSNVAQAYQRYQDVQKEAASKQAEKKTAADPSADPASTGTDSANPGVQPPGAVAELVASAGMPFTKEKSHREVRAASIEFDKEAGEFIVTMRPNQTFIANSMQVMEGRFSAGLADPKTVGAVNQETPIDPLAAAMGMPGGGTQAPSVAGENAIANQLVDNLKQARGLAADMLGGGSVSQPPSSAAAPATAPASTPALPPVPATNSPATVPELPPTP